MSPVCFHWAFPHNPALSNSCKDKANNRIVVSWSRNNVDFFHIRSPACTVPASAAPFPLQYSTGLPELQSQQAVTAIVHNHCVNLKPARSSSPPRPYSFLSSCPSVIPPHKLLLFSFHTTSNHWNQSIDHSQHSTAIIDDIFVLLLNPMKSSYHSTRATDYRS